MTDEQIIKAMQCVIGNSVDCTQCEYQETLPFPSCMRMCAENALDLIKRQKAKNENEIKEIKSEAIKEFAERLKEKLQWDVEFDNKLVFESDIDNLVKEMTKGE